MRWLVALLVCGCGRVGFDSAGGIDGNPGPGGDVSGETTGSPCAPMLPVVDDFADGVTPCMPWGTMFESNGGQVRESGGRLILDLPAAATMTSGASCSGDTLLDLAQHMLVLEVVDAPIGLFVQLRASRMAGTEWVMQSANGRLIFHDGSNELASASYDRTAHRWWRLRATGLETIAEVAPDGITWTELGRTAQVDPSVTVSIDALAFAGFGKPVVLDNLNICP
ncbi:MAG: hypothetical protein H0T42_32315 [Deltaproteobacteria bacterium]|nr:hypothetical protein [Deltaproteobacteria bacterium]